MDGTGVDVTTFEEAGLVDLPPGGRVAVIGDVGGHRVELERELARLGADASGRLPDDLVVVQVGDLVHRGPDSAGVVALVDRYLTEQPDRWVQLVGNHEAQYLREPAFAWPERIDEGAADTLRGWWRDGRLLVAAAIGGPEPTLVTHAGLTVEFWRQVLDAPADARRAAMSLNALAQLGHEVVFRPGVMLGGGEPDPLAGPLWAHARTELVPGWVGRPLPFSQVHGHSAVGGRHGHASLEIARRTTVDRAAGHEVTVLDGGRIVGVDPGHGRTARPTWSAYVLTG